MTSLSQDIKDKLSNLNVLEKIIAINVVVFLVGLVLKTGFSWFELPSNFSDFIVKPWSIITYAFLHGDLWHILFNMLWLYFIGRMFLNLFSSKMALNIYFLGAISGGLLYMICYTLFPNIFGVNSRLVGASAAVRALLIFICAYMPNQEVRFFTFNLKLWYIGVAIIILDVLGLFGSNSGGYLAHLGGALLGYVYAKQLVKGQDIGKGFEKFMDAFISMFKFSKKAPLKTVHKNKSKVGGYTKGEFNQFNNQKKIDIILDKISKSGYDSLTAEEKEFLFKAGK
ncbi:rhomboid family protein [Jejuia spongiicola]|uniref:Rhomboid family intramembrane serine protease n=1 Tax=Jejuia spongiicola TaxID=2942207 RepID=A0ABT0QHZ0_9FLAO|nr:MULTISPECIES: rhomboid family intramembrane serine protease [Flavobacteriaceae]MCL6296611.1 rhomboid family intramembrane serine protease [Jejuia spongiicola]PIA80729.1 rhomboid family intramembrane serine protease [Gaetbulibacter sp. 4G1]